MEAELTLPKLGLTMIEATVVEWRVAPGAPFHKGDALAVLETDKIAHDLEAPADGTLSRILVAAGENAAVGAALAVYVTGGSATPTATAAAEASAGSVAPPAPAPDGRSASTDAGRRVRASPRARRIASERGVSLVAVAGTGPGGRITAADVLEAPVEAEPAPAAPGAAPAMGRRRPATPFEAALTRRLVRANQEVPQFYLATEADARPLADYLESLRSVASGPRMTLTHLILAAAARALANLPELNRVWVDGEVLNFDAVDVGLAVDAPGGLVVPVLRAVERLGLGGIAAESARLVAAARTGALAAGDVGGGAITLSNAGMHDVTYMYPLVTPGQSAILGTGSIRDVFRPDGQGRPELRREIGLVMTFDHRVFDGVSGLRLLNAIKAGFESPHLLPAAA